MRVPGGGERGAVAAEMAIIAPFLFLILFGIVEFGYGFSQDLNVRHGAREASRLAAVNHAGTQSVQGSSQSAAMVAEICSRLDVAEGSRVTLALPGGDQAGDTVEVTVESDLELLTGFFDGMLGDKVLTSTVESRLEVDATWAEVTGAPCS